MEGEHDRGPESRWRDGISLRATEQAPMPARKPPEPDHYRLYPSIPMPEGRIDVGTHALAEHLVPVLDRGGTVLFDGYPGVLWERLRRDVIEALEGTGLRPSWHDVRTAMLEEAELDRMLEPYLTDDPVFGKRFPGHLRDFFNHDRLAAIADQLARTGPQIVFGPGAALVDEGRTGGGGFVAYADVPKNEIQYRSRAGAVTNLGKAAPEDAKAMYKRFYFVDWVVANRHKEVLLPGIDLMVDAQRPGELACTTGNDLRRALAAVAQTPFRARPWFAPGAWGGDRIKRLVPELPQDVPNYAWSFELIAPENGIVFKADGTLLEVSFDLVMFQEKQRILGCHADRLEATSRSASTSWTRYAALTSRSSATHRPRTCGTRSANHSRRTRPTTSLRRWTGPR